VPKQFVTVIEPGASISPPSQQVAAGETAVFTLTTTLPPPLTYQWRLNGVSLPGETNLTLMISDVQTTNAGNYSVTVINPESGFAFHTPPASLTGPVIITQQPESQIARTGTNATFRVVATGSAPMSYQWRLNGLVLAGATNDTLAITNVQLSDDGVYSVAVSNSYGNFFSVEAKLTVLIKPIITVQPLSQTVAAGGTVTLSLVAEGHPFPLGFRWRKDGATLTNIVVNGSSCFFTVTNVQTSGTNHLVAYTVAVTNAAGSILSSNAILTVLADTDGDGLPDEWEIAHGLNVTDGTDATLDPDGDGLTNLQEYLSGTDPLDSESRLQIKTDGWSKDGLLFLSFTAMSNKTYTIQSCASVDGAPWSRVADMPAAPATRTVVVTDTAGPGNSGLRFYRLVTPRVP